MTTGCEYQGSGGSGGQDGGREVGVGVGVGVGMWSGGGVGGGGAVRTLMPRAAPSSLSGSPR